MKRWRRGHIHFSPAARPLLQAGSPEWSVASDAEGGTRRAGRAVTHSSKSGVCRCASYQKYYLVLIIRGCGVDILILRDIAEFCDHFRRDDYVTGGEQVLERLRKSGPTAASARALRG
ncbi:hypothetical protein GCM10027435_02380 [Haloparvum alkalitolerans]